MSSDRDELQGVEERSTQPCGLRYELKILDNPYNSQGELIVLPGGKKTGLDDVLGDDGMSALCLTRFSNRDGDLNYSEMKVNSPHVQNALRHVVPKES